MGVVQCQPVSACTCVEGRREDSQMIGSEAKSARKKLPIHQAKTIHVKPQQQTPFQIDIFSMAPSMIIPKKHKSSFDLQKSIIEVLQSTFCLVEKKKQRHMVKSSNVFFPTSSPELVVFNSPSVWLGESQAFRSSPQTQFVWESRTFPSNYIMAHWRVIEICLCGMALTNHFTWIFQTLCRSVKGSLDMFGM